jgi:hypothetical protein
VIINFVVIIYMELLGIIDRRMCLCVPVAVMQQEADKLQGMLQGASHGLDAHASEPQDVMRLNQ